MNTMHESNGPRENTLSRAVSYAVATAIACAIGDASAQCQYSVQTWTPFNCPASSANHYFGAGLNNLGGWCGHRSMCYPGEGEGYFAVYCPPGGSPVKLAMPPNAGPKGAQATAVNDAGVVVGFSYQGPSGSQFIGCIWWPDGTVQEISPMPGEASSKAVAINASNQILLVGSFKSYLWSNGATTSIEGAPGATAARISNDGLVIGNYGIVSNNTGRGFRWRAGEFETLQPLAPHLSSSARGVNSAGVVVGTSITFQSPLGFLYTPTMWDNDQPTPLALPAGYLSGGCYQINDQGVVVGYALPGWSSGGGEIQIAWINGVPYKLTDLVGGTVPIGESRHLNQIGQILSTSGAKVLSPIDPPPADLNGDCAVDGSELMKLLSEWGPREWSVADINHDGVVNGADLAQVLGNWTGSK